MEERVSHLTEASGNSADPTCPGYSTEKAHFSKACTAACTTAPVGLFESNTLRKGLTTECGKAPKNMLGSAKKKPLCGICLYSFPGWCLRFHQSRAIQPNYSASLHAVPDISRILGDYKNDTVPRIWWIDTLFGFITSSTSREERIPSETKTFRNCGEVALVFGVDSKLLTKLISATKLKKNAQTVPTSEPLFKGFW